MMKTQRHYSSFDKLCLNFDQALRAICGGVKMERPYPAEHIEDTPLSLLESKHAAGLMRVNHAGEVCAQALYQGQGLVSRRLDIQEQMQQAAREEGDHLAWCEQRLHELNSHSSYFNPLWYMGSFMIGVAAGIIGDEWSLGFVVETERQVIKHLEKHLQLLPEHDIKSLRILEQMQEDEAHHRDNAITAGAAMLPNFIKKIMAVTSKIMVKTAYWI